MKFPMYSAEQYFIFLRYGRKGLEMRNHENFFSELLCSIPDLRDRRKKAKEIANWIRSGKPIPPPHAYKQKIVKNCAKEHQICTFVETGTYLGDMVYAMKHEFDKIYSIELSAELHEKARDRFRKEKHIEIILGDSGKKLGDIVRGLDEPALFWLDGHYSGRNTAKGEKETPILEELHQIFSGSNKGHVVIIDDARCFGVDPEYPTLDRLFAYIRSMQADTDILVEGDAIRISPKKQPIIRERGRLPAAGGYGLCDEGETEK